VTEILSRRIEIWACNFLRITDHKHRFATTLHSKFFIRIVQARAGFEIELRGRFQRHDIVIGCSRDVITVWDANLSCTANLATFDETFFYDDSLSARIQRR
jgi:hypothetical protein